MYIFDLKFTSDSFFFINISVRSDLYERSDIQFATAYDSSTALYSMQGNDLMNLH